MSSKHWLSALALWAAMTVAAVAAPPMKALIIDGQNNHNWKETTPHLKKLLEETGLFSVDVVTVLPGQETKDFKPKFDGYQVVVMNYNNLPTNQDWPDEAKKALETYVAGGGGLVSFHAADNAFRDWKEYNKMIGLGGWAGRNETDGPYLYYKDGKLVRDPTKGPGGGHGPQSAFQLVVREPHHPITEGLPPIFRHAPDELYATLRGPAENLTVLATAFADKALGGTGRDEPMLMAIDYGKGRVFHTTLGHSGQQCKSVAFIVTYQRGAEWAATGKVTQKVPADFPGPDKPSVRD
jgi:type 1 glutamine amidotransferase